MPGYTVRDIAISRDLRIEEDAERVRREARVAKQMPLAQAVARHILLCVEMGAEDVADALDWGGADSDSADVRQVCEDLIGMANEEEDGAAIDLGLSHALLEALWRLDVLACEPEMLPRDRVRFDGFGSIEAIRRALDTVGGAK